MTSIDLDVHPADLSWADVAPTTWTFDPGSHRRRAVPLAIDALMDTPRDGDQWRHEAVLEINRRFTRAFGPWASGWRWSRDEGSIGGGVVGAWCCSTHSLLPSGPNEDPSATAERAAAALAEWCAWIVKLSALFDEMPPKDADLGRTVRDASARIVEVVVEQTNAGDAWYAHCAQVLRWYLERWGAEPEIAASIVATAVAGRFASWSGPDDAMRDAVASAIAEQNAQTDGAKAKSS